MNELPSSVPRAYQSELFIQACQGNIIAVMGTGTGKTLIAINLIKWMATRGTDGGRHQVSVFLVPAVPLVFQQTTAIRAETPLVVKPYCGEMGVDFWDHEKWILELDLENTDVLVMTPQIFYNALTHAFMDISSVGLIVMDEVHHCRKRHPYNTIMEEFYHPLSPTSRPKILGLTASPIWNLKSPLGGLQTLEMNTQSKIVAVKTNADELERYANEPVEEVVFYRPSVGLQPTRLFADIMALGLVKVGKEHLDKVGTKAIVALEVLGEVAMDRYLLESLLSPTKDIIMLHEMTSSDGRLDGRLLQLRDLLEARTVMEDEPIFSRKILSLVESLQYHRSQNLEKSDYQAIIFVQQRHIASNLSFLLHKIPDIPWISARTLVGHGSHGRIALEEQDFKRQEAIVADFRAGVFNVLISTSVGEEGLDFPACDLVIRFDAIHTMVGYVQSRGRARMKKSKYVVMVDETNQDGYAKYLAYSNAEGRMTEVYKHQRGPIPEYDEEENDINESDRRSRERYVVQTTGAILTYGEAVSLVNQTCALLPSAEGADASRPSYQISNEFGTFSARITMPSVCSLPRDKLSAWGGSRSNKSEAKRAVAFYICKVLHQHGLLNDYLLPNREKVPVDMDSVENEPDLKHELIIQVPATWGDGSMREPSATLSLHRVKIDGVAQVGIICTRSIPPVGLFKLWRGHNEAETAVTVQVEEPTTLDFNSVQEGRSVGFQILDSSTRYIITTMLRPQWTKDIDLSIFFAILDGQGNIDWLSMAAMCSASANGAFAAGNILLDSLGKQFIVECLRTEINPMSQRETVDGKCRESDHESYLDYANKHLRKTRASWEAEITPDTPMLQVRRLPNRRHNLQPMYVLQKERPIEKPNGFESHPSVLISSLCNKLSITASTREDVMLFPAIMRRIVDLDRMHTETALLNLSPLPRDLLHQALTPPGAGYGYDYQRLETLGDNVLKLLTTVYLFQEYPLKQEGTLTKYRNVCVSNKFLRLRAFEAGLGSRLCAEEVLVRRWEPPAHGDECIAVKRKWLQDCLEALLGASYLSGGLPSAIKLGAQFRLRTGSLDMWNQQAVVRTGVPNAGPHALQGLQDVLGYRFKSIALLVESLTHPSFPILETRPYDRLEFLGDTVIDFYILRYLYGRYPDASPGLLTFYKRCVVCNAGLAYISVRKLRLHLYLLRLSPVVDALIRDGITLLESLDLQTMMENVWEHHPPKVLGDVLESVVGAILVDSGYDLEECDRVMAPIFEEALGALQYAKRDDPAQELFMWTNKIWKCTHLAFVHSTLVVANTAIHEMVVIVHGEVIATAKHANRYVAKCKVAQEALELLQLENRMERICTCSQDEEMDVEDVDQDINEDAEVDGD